MTVVSSAEFFGRQWALALIDRMMRDDAYGKLHLSFEKGRITHAQECRNRKPDADTES